MILASLVKRFRKAPLGRNFGWKETMMKHLQDTFGEEKDRVKEKLEKVKKEAKKRREELEKWEALSDEEKLQMEEMIPEHRRGQVEVKIDAEEEEDKLSYSQRVVKRLKEKYKGTEFYKEFSQSEEMKEYSLESEKLSEQLGDAKENLKGSIPVNKEVREGAQEIMRTTGFVGMKDGGNAFRVMRERDPNFDIDEFDDICKGIFIETHALWKDGEIDLLREYCGHEGLGLITSTLNSYEELGIEPMYKAYLNLDQFGFTGAKVVKKLPVFSFYAVLQEIDCLVYKENNDQKLESLGYEEDEGPKIYSGNPNEVEKVMYLFSVAPHEEQIDHIFGHNYQVVQFQIANKHKQIF